MYEGVIDIIGDSPLNEFFPHLLSVGLVELSGPQEPQQVMFIPLRFKLASVVIGDEDLELIECLKLLG